MKLVKRPEQPKDFIPVTIALETPEELVYFIALLYAASDTTFREVTGEPPQSYDTGSGLYNLYDSLLQEAYSQEVFQPNLNELKLILVEKV